MRSAGRDQACRAVVRADVTLNAALSHRHDTMARLWPVLHRFGPKWLATEMRDGIITDSILRSIASKMTPRPSRGPRVGPSPTTDEAKAIGELTEACRAVDDARSAHRGAVDQRIFTIRDR